MPTVESNSINMYYEVHGSGEPLVIINGLGMELSESVAISRPFAEKYKVLTFDNRGAGRSDKPDEPYTIDMFAKDTAGLMHATGFSKSNIMGISLGGRIALELTLQHPEMVNKLVLVSTSARIQSNWARRLLTSPPPKFFYWGKYPQPRYAFMRQREASGSYNATDRLSKIKAPTLILHGRSDKVVPLALAEELNQGINGSQLMAFKGGHMFFMLRSRQKFISASTDWLSE
jgi:pimeloyl-ACP methyl ester carboxylesterase